MATEKRLIDAMNTVTKISKRVSALIQCGTHPTDVYNVVLDTIAEAPTVDAVEVAHGRWKFLNDYQSRCSECHEVMWVDHNAEPNYCPNCGAKMDGDGNA